MCLLSRVLVALIICLTAIVVPAAPVQAACVPYDIELSTESGMPGTEITVYGHDFLDDRVVDLYYDGKLIATDRTNSGGDFTIIFTIPEGCTGYYEIEANLGYTRVSTYFKVKPGLIVSPQKGPVGTTVTVAGRGFAKNEEGIELMYYLDGDYETIERNIIADSKGSWDESFQIPLSSKGDHKLDAEGDESRLYEVKETTFKVTPDISIDKSSGIVGESVNMTGSRFANNEKGITILFDEEAVATDIKASTAGDWEASFEVPEMPAGEHSVTAEGEKTGKEDTTELSFFIKPDIVLSADEGYVGMNLTVTGSGFAAGEDVTITYNGSQVATSETDDKGSFDISFLVPESECGGCPVTAEDAAENGATAILIMESEPPPVPELISPSDGSRLGLISKVTPTFEWSDVSDTSGIAYYRLQIATSTNVNGSGEFADPIVSKDGLAGTSYTLGESEALSYGTYYWMVQAVDSAENESEWTGAHSFRADIIPRWGLIAASVAAVLLLVALIRLLLRRRDIFYDRW
jgi:hypothetical protein